MSSETNESMNEETIWLYINQMTQKRKNLFGGLIHFMVEGLHWKLNFRGDAPLLQYHTNGIKHILQVDGDLFYPIEVKLGSFEHEEGIFDAFLMPMEETLNFINTMFYEDMELEYNDDAEPGENHGDDYEIYYDGDNEEIFEKILEKMIKWERIEEEDVVNL